MDHRFFAMKFAYFCEIPAFLQIVFVICYFPVFNYVL